MKKKKAPEILTTKKPAIYLQMDEATNHLLVKKRKILSLKIAGQLLCKKDVIDKWKSVQSLERITENIRSSPNKKDKKIND